MRAPADHYVHQNKRSSSLYYLRDVPKDLRDGVGKAKWKISLGTANRALAIKKARQLAFEHDHIIAAARKPDPITTLPPAQRKLIDDAGGLQAYLGWLEQRAREADHQRSQAEFWRDFPDEDGPLDEVPDPDWAAARVAGLEAEHRAIHAQIARDVPMLKTLDVTEAKLRQSGRHLLADAIEADLVDPHTITLGGIFESWRRQKKPRAPEQYQYPVRLFEQLHGALPIKKITRQHIREFRDILAQLPRAGGPAMARLTLQQMLRRAEEKALPRLSEPTAAKYFRSIKTIFAFALDEGYLEASPADGLKFYTARRKASHARTAKRRPLTPEETSQLLSGAATYLAREPDYVWFVWLYVYSGARPEELAQLAASDVKEYQGIAYLRLHDEGDNKLKNQASFRVVPIHRVLQARGFMQFVQSRSERRYLFEVTPDARGRLYSDISRRLRGLMRTHLKINDPRAVPYSVRHAFKDCMRMIGAPEPIEDRIMGHSTPDRIIARGYGNPDQLPVLKEWIDKVDPLDRGRIAVDL